MFIVGCLSIEGWSLYRLLTLNVLTVIESLFSNQLGHLSLLGFSLQHRTRWHKVNIYRSCYMENFACVRPMPSASGWYNLCQCIKINEVHYLLILSCLHAIDFDCFKYIWKNLFDLMGNLILYICNTNKSNVKYRIVWSRHVTVVLLTYQNIANIRSKTMRWHLQ